MHLVLYLGAALIVLLPTMLFVVPTLTRGSVTVPAGGLLRCSLAVGLIVFVEALLWALLIMSTNGSVPVTEPLTFGIVGLLFNGAVIYALGRIAPTVLYVKSFLWASAAAAIMTLVLSVVNFLLG